jgi:hypothetical protein
MRELTLEKSDVVFEMSFRSPMKRGPVFLVASETPRRRFAVFAQLVLSVASRGAKFVDRATQSAQRRSRTEDFVGRFPFDFEPREPVGIGRSPRFLDFVPKVLALRRPVTAAIGMKVLHEPAVNRARIG